MSAGYSDNVLEAYLEEGLPQERMAALEEALRNDPTLVDRLLSAIGRRDAGVHSVGSVWRRFRLSCPSREQLGSYLLGVLDTSVADFVKFHTETTGCRFCCASLDDLRQQQEASSQSDAESRRQKYFQSSQGYLMPDNPA